MNQLTYKVFKSTGILKQTYMVNVGLSTWNIGRLTDDR